MRYTVIQSYVKIAYSYMVFVLSVGYMPIGPYLCSTSINQSRIFRVVQVIKSLQDPLAVGNNLPGINDNVRERGLEQK